jgi:hypothetical protein
MTWPSVLSYVGTFVAGIFVGALGQYFADLRTDRRRDREARARQQKEFERVQNIMPALIEAMRQDLAEWPDIRKVMLIKHASDTDHFVYGEAEHPRIRENLTTLEASGFVERALHGNVPSYRMTEEFVGFVIGR